MSVVEDAVEQLQWFAEDFPDAVRLARLASLAARIEPNLLRRLRVDLLPDVDVGAEADLWFGPLIESSGADSIVMDAAIVDVLRSDLARDRALLDRVATITRDSHAHLPPALQLEEEVIALALRGGDEAAAAIDMRLRVALRAMTRSAEQAGEIARWVLRAWRRMPDIVRSTRSGTTLAMASATLLRRRSGDSPLDADASLDDVGWLFPDNAFESSIVLSADLHDGRLSFFEHVGGVPLIVPATEPPLVELRWRSAETQNTRLVEATPGTTAHLGPDVATVTLRTLAGTEYEVISTRTSADAAAQKQPSPWVELPDHEAVGACVRVTPIENEVPTEATGFWITSTHVVTARSPFVGQRSLIVESDSGRARGEVQNAADAEAVLIVAMPEGSLKPFPVPFATPGFRTSRPTPDDGFDIENMDVVVLGTVDGIRGAVRGTTRIDQMMPPEYVVYVESDQPVPHGFAGGPVIIDGKLTGLVTSIEYDAKERRSVLVVASGSLIQQAMERSTRREPVGETVAREGVEEQSVADQPVSGHRFARVLIVANDDEQADRIIRSLTDGSRGSFIGPHRGLWWVRDATAGELRAGIVLQASRRDPLWPVSLDLADAALIVMTRPESGDSHGRSLRDAITARAGSTPVLTGEAVELAAESGRATTKQQVDTGAALREAIIRQVDWSRLPDVGEKAFESAISMAPRELQPDPPVVRLEEYLERTSSRLGTDWFPVLAPLAGERTIEFANIVIRDPDFFADAVLATAHAIADEQQYGLPALPIDNLEKHLWQVLGERLGSVPVRPPDLVRAVAAELENAGSAATVSTDYGPVVVLPYLMQDRTLPASGQPMTRVMRAQWTGVTETAFVPLLASKAWSSANIEEIGWDGGSGRGEALVRHDGLIRIEAATDRALAELTVSFDETGNWFDLSAEVRSIRGVIEEVLSRNASLSIEEDPLEGAFTQANTETLA